MAIGVYVSVMLHSCRRSAIRREVAAGREAEAHPPPDLKAAT